MKKREFVFILVIFLIFISQIVAAQLTLEKEAIHEVVAKELSQPATFLVTVKNHASQTDFFEFYTFVNVLLSPKGSTTIAGGSEEQFILSVYPTARLREERKGSYTFVYYMKSREAVKEDRLIINILPLSEILKIKLPEIISLDTSQIILGVNNQENIVLNNTVVSVKAAFIDTSQKLSLAPFEKENITLAVDTNKLKNILAGKYLVKISFTVNDEATVDMIKEVDVREKSNIATTEEEFGTLFYPALRITKLNEGNTITDIDIVVRKNIFAKAFTSFSLKPSKAEKTRTFYTFKWHATLKPGESFSVEVKTNYLLPLGILLAIVLISLLVMLWLKTDLIIRKKVTRIKSKTGEFAMKVMLLIKARDYISNITLKDKLPRLAELHERYGTIKPSKVDKEKKILEWHLPNLNKGEEHIFSYVIYSKVSILGRFEIPKAVAIFKDLKGKQGKAVSNAVLFFSEEKVPT